MASYETNLALVRDSLHLIAKHLTAAPKARPTNDTKTAIAKLHSLLLCDNSPFLERFYFIHMLCQICSNESPNKVDKLMKLILPTTPTPQSMSLVSDIISFALCHPSIYASVLDNLSYYCVSSEVIKIEIESWNQAVSLAIDSPSFCSAILSRSDLAQMDIDKRLLAKWLQDLSKTEQEFPAVNLNQIIRHSLLDSESHVNISPSGSNIGNKSDLNESDLHFCILTLIQSKRCQTITNQFLIEVANTLSQKVLYNESEKRKTMLLDRFGQILSVAAASKVTSITNSLRAALGSLESNQLIAAVVRWQNK